MPHFPQILRATKCEKLSDLIFLRLLLDSRVVDLPRSSNLIVVTPPSLKPLFFNGLKKVLPFLDHDGA
jgi:hypothetical protein